MAAKKSLNRVWNYLGSSLQDFANVLAPYMPGGQGNKLVSETRELTLDTSGSLTLNTGDLTIATDPNSGDDILINSTDRLTLQAGNKLINNENTGGHAYLYAGRGSDGDTITAAGDGGRIRVYAGDAGNTTGGPKAFGGQVYIRGGYTTEVGSQGGAVFIYGGNSTDGIIGDVYIGDYYRSWIFNENNGTLAYPLVNLSLLPDPQINIGMRAIINDSSITPSGAFGTVAVGGGNKIVPVFSDGNDWLIG
jgi:hypothetical protein